MSGRGCHVSKPIQIDALMPTSNPCLPHERGPGGRDSLTCYAKVATISYAGLKANLKGS